MCECIHSHPFVVANLGLQRNSRNNHNQNHHPSIQSSSEKSSSVSPTKHSSVLKYSYSNTSNEIATNASSNNVVSPHRSSNSLKNDNVPVQNEVKMNANNYRNDDKFVKKYDRNRDHDEASRLKKGDRSNLKEVKANNFESPVVSTIDDKRRSFGWAQNLLGSNGPSVPPWNATGK